jgi:hypothetical protein
VFCAEQRAIQYELRLPDELEVPGRLLHPRVVALLINPRALQLLVLSYAHGLLSRREGRWTLMLDDISGPLTDDEDRTLLAACDQFILGKQRRDLLHALSYNDAKLAAALDKLLSYSTDEHTARIDAAMQELRRQYRARLESRPPSQRDRMSGQMHEDLEVLLLLLLCDLRASIVVSGDRERGSR